MSEAKAGKTSKAAKPKWPDIGHVHDITLGGDGALLTKGELDELKALVLKHHELWNRETSKTPSAHGVVCDIALTGEPKMRARSTNTNPAARKEVARLVQEQKDKGIIVDSCSPYSSTVLLVPKAGGGTRFCVDFRALNKIVRRDAYPLPRVEDSLAALQGMKYFSSIDIVTAFWQVPLSERSRQLTAFATPDGLYEYLRMPMGLCTASGVFAKFIDEVLAGLKWHCVLTYIDDCLIYSKTFSAHLTALEAVFSRLEGYGLTLGAKKTFLAAPSVRFLGHVIDSKGIHPDPAKIQAIAALTMPDDKKNLRSTLGIFGYYRRFCKDFSTVAAPLTAALVKDLRLPRNDEGDVVWSPEQITAFDKLKLMLIGDPMLAHPHWSSPFKIDTDACKHGLDAVISQTVDGVERVVAYASLANGLRKGVRDLRA